jgi:hypothetical protein
MQQWPIGFTCLFARFEVFTAVKIQVWVLVHNTMQCCGRTPTPCMSMLPPWRWRQHGHPKCWHLITTPQRYTASQPRRSRPEVLVYLLCIVHLVTDHTVLCLPEANASAENKKRGLKYKAVRIQQWSLLAESWMLIRYHMSWKCSVNCQITVSHKFPITSEMSMILLNIQTCTHMWKY